MDTATNSFTPCGACARGNNIEKENALIIGVQSCGGDERIAKVIALVLKCEMYVYVTPHYREYVQGVWSVRRVWSVCGVSYATPDSVDSLRTLRTLGHSPCCLPHTDSRIPCGIPATTVTLSLK